VITLYVTLHTLGVRLRQRHHDRTTDERGLTTVEIALWAAAFVVLAGIVYLAFQTFIQGKLSQLG